jgi:hypothetical protein
MKKITQEELNEIIQNHKLWLEGETKGKRADLSYSDLSYSNLSWVDLRGVDLSYSNLIGANLSNSDLRGADLRGADLRGSDLSYSNFRGADLRGSYLKNSDLSGIDLEGSDLSYLDLRGADLGGSNLKGTIHDLKILKSITSFKWNIVIKNDLVTVGCQEHTYKQWLALSKDEISKMESKALEFYPTLIILLEQVFENTEYEIKE